MKPTAIFSFGTTCSSDCSEAVEHDLSFNQLKNQRSVNPCFLRQRMERNFHSFWPVYERVLETVFPFNFWSVYVSYEFCVLRQSKLKHFPKTIISSQLKLVCAVEFQNIGNLCVEMSFHNCSTDQLKPQKKLSLNSNLEWDIENRRKKAKLRKNRRSGLPSLVCWDRG